MLCPTKVLSGCIIRQLMMIAIRILRPWKFGGIQRLLGPAERVLLRTGLLSPLWLWADVVRRCGWMQVEARGCGVLTSTWSIFDGGTQNSHVSHSTIDLYLPTIDANFKVKFHVVSLKIQYTPNLI